MVIVAVATKNPVKLAAVKEVLANLYGTVEVIPVEPPQGISKQPLCFSEILEGCFSRSKAALDAGQSVDYGIGIESGLVELRKGLWVVTTAACVCSRDGYCSVGLGPGFQLPDKVVQLIVEGGYEMEEAMRVLYGVERLGEKEGAVGLFSKGLVTRKDLTANSLVMALLPFISREEYAQRSNSSS